MGNRKRLHKDCVGKVKVTLEKCQSSATINSFTGLCLVHEAEYQRSDKGDRAVEPSDVPMGAGACPHCGGFVEISFGINDDPTDYASCMQCARAVPIRYRDRRGVSA